MTAAIRCIVRATSEGLAFPSMLLDNRSISDYFHEGSNGDIDLQLEDAPPLDPGLRAVDDAELNAILRLTTLNPSNVDKVERIGLLVAGSSSERPDLPVFGYMFDTGFAGSSSGTVAREGCVVFADTIRAQRGTDQGFADEMLFTAIHELGHVFNLWHIDAPQNMMARSPLQTTLPPPFLWTDAHAQFLALCSKQPVVHPGGSRFGHRGTFGPFDDNPQNTPRSAAFGLDLDIDIAQREFHAFEPVELELTLRVANGIGRTFEVPDALDPGYRTFEIWIEQPDEERRRYRPTKHFCGIPGTLTIAPGQPFRRDISIFGSARGYTFRQAGVHKVWVRVFLPEGGVLVSNTISVNILPEPVTERRVRFADALRDPRMAQLLFYRSTPLRGADGQPLRALRRFADEPAYAALLYAQGRAYVRSSQRSRSPRSEEQRRRESLRWLADAAEHPRLSPHRREKAIMLLRDLT